ncbi:MAG: histidine kinase N-terminal domain-containing protein, partial [Acidimicrobiia bacterium]|nr:histidine kinase N-terminal domain-containing protein [Acidimicrobiia bacterium]
MATLAELARSHTDLAEPQIDHLSRLVASWGPLADLCFADLLLLAPVDGSHGSRLVVIGQVRPTTNQTVYRSDFVGRVLEEVDRPLVARALRSGDIVEGEADLSPVHDRVRVL